ncbi:hypothetical protein PLICRDRAFT_117928 [Plicaturopsis crispa FD-325 SS-3]|uniref:Cytochrome c oxidase assembly factor 6 n=1 Tax=Plicaturopsis crispa FD-325 SS-3 TaxID=944288 RepID=A0A0C9T869_PLICR|nr:hypothetical protein PLICRDRAFT_117928 [Plicaturopsis crispa FD-325 SS-3]
MGLFGLFSSKPEAAPDAASRQDRQKCWESRDAYFACLDSAGVLIAGEEGNKCASQNARYEENCARSWIDYFNKRRVIAEQQKSRVEQSRIQAQNARR